MAMAVTNRYYGINYGADISTVTNSASTTSKHVEVRFNQGDASGSAAEQQQRLSYRDQQTAIASLQKIIDRLKSDTDPWPAPLV